MKTEVLVKLAARDPWSFTVLDALRCKFGIEAVVGVERLKSWQLDFDLDSMEEALRLTSKVLDETALLANPNRDIWKVRGASGLELPASFTGDSDGADTCFAVRVTDRDDLVGRSVGDVLRKRLGMTEIGSLAFSLVWILEFDRPGDEAFRLAEQIAVARSWRKGLLANPHCQEAVVLRLRDYLEGRESAL